MKKTLLTFLLLVCTIVAGAVSQDEPKRLTARPARTAPISLTNARKSRGQAPKLLGTQRQSTNKAQRKAEGQTIELNFNTDDFSYKWFDGEDASFWYFGCFDETGNYLVRLAYNTESQTGTINYSDMNLEYSYLVYSNEDDEETFYKELKYQEGTQVTISEDELYVSVEGKLVCDDGNTYNVHATCTKPQPQTYDIEGETITMADYDEDYKQWDIRFKDEYDNWKVCLSLKSEDGKIGGTYSIADASDDGCFAEDLNEDEDYGFTEMNVTITVPEGVTSPKEGCEITGTAKDGSGNTFNFHMLKNPPIQPKEVKTIDVEVATAEWPSETTGGSYYEVSEKQNPNNKWVISLTQKMGESTSEQFGGIDTTATYREDITTGEQLHLNNGTITQSFDAEKLVVAVEAALVMNDSIQYNFSFTTPVSMVDEKTLTFTDLQIDRSYSEWGSTSLNASNDSIQLSAQLTDYADIPGEYTDENCQIGLTVYTKGEEYPVYVSSNAIVYAKGETAEDGTPVFKTKFLGDDKIVYTIEASYVKPTPTETLTYDLTECDFANNIEWGEGFYFAHTSEDHYVWIRLESQDKVEGHYTMADINNNSRIELLNEYGMPKQFYLCDADFNVTSDGRIYTLQGTCQAGPYAVNLKMTYTMEGDELDSYEEDVDVTFTRNDLKEITPYNEEGVQYVYVKLVNKERNDELCLVVIPEEPNGAEIPVAEYEINSWSWGNYVQAGQSDGMNLYPSYYAKLDAEGNVKDPLWFLVSGTMTVTNDEAGNIAFEINAKNSYARTVHATFSLPTGITTAKADTEQGGVVKFLKDREVVIRKNGIDYNVAGMRK